MKYLIKKILVMLAVALLINCGGDGAKFETDALAEILSEDEAVEVLEESEILATNERVEAPAVPTESSNINADEIDSVELASESETENRPDLPNRPEDPALAEYCEEVLAEIFEESETLSLFDEEDTYSQLEINIIFIRCKDYLPDEYRPNSALPENSQQILDDAGENAADVLGLLG